MCETKWITRIKILTAAISFVLVLGGHCMQLVCCESGWYHPFLHGTQLLMVPFRYVPGVQTGNEHSSMLDDPVFGVVLPSGQLWHAAWIPCILYVPLGQASHFPSRPSCLPLSHSSLHSLIETASVVRVVFPKPQIKHENEPSSGW